MVEFVDATVAPNLETLDFPIVLPAGAVQCPIEYPFSSYGPNTDYVEQCCKCQSQTKCRAASGATHYHIGGAVAMMQPNEVVDKSEFSN